VNFDDPRWLDSRLARTLSRLGRTRQQRAALLLAGALLAFLLGRWSGGEAVPQKKEPKAGSAIGRALVLDGDTIEVDGVRVRLFGIDAPERDQICERSDGRQYNCGQTARDALVDAIGSGMVRCVRRDTDPYGRMVAVCNGDDGDLSAILVRRGVALAYRQYSDDYVDEEDRARKSHLGLWQGRFEAPWEHRHRSQRSDGR